MGSYTSFPTTIPADAVEPLERLRRLQELAYDGLVEGEWDENTLGPDLGEGEPGYARKPNGARRRQPALQERFAEIARQARAGGKSPER